MFKINDLVQYGVDGVCRITDITTRELRDKQIDYYVLKPVFNSNATLFVPLNNEALVSKMRYTMSADEIADMIREAYNSDCEWIENDNDRSIRCKEIISGGNSPALVRLIKALRTHRQEMVAVGKKLHMADERFVKEAERLLNDEYAVALGVTPDEAVPVIRSIIEDGSAD